MQIQNALITGSFSYNGADLSNITSSNAYSASLSIRTTNLESTSSVLVGASSSFSSILTSVSSSQQQISASLLTLTASYNALSSSYTALSASYNTASSSFSTRITSDSSSMSSRTTQVEKTYASTGSNTFTGLQNFSNTCTPNSFTAGASIYTAGGLQVTQDSYFSSSVFIKGNVTVFGTQSVSYISSSQLDIGTNIITVNTSTPSVRYGGLSVFDSGSTGLTGSIFWDSELNRWIYVNASGSGGGATYGGGMFISGPRNTVGLGCEQGTTACMLLVGQGGDHLTSSMIYHSSTVTCIPNTLIGSTICTTMANASCIGIGTTTPSTPLEIYAATGNQLKISTNDATSANNSGIFFYNEASATSSTRRSYILLDPNGANGSGGDYSYFDMYGSGTTRVMNQLTSGVLALGVGGTNIINITGSSVGIGTASPGEKLQVNGNVLISGGQVYGATSYGNAALTATYGFNSSDLVLSAGNCERMRISGAVVSINQTCGYSVFNLTGTDCGWGEGIVMNPAPNGYSALHFRLEGRTGSCTTCTWQLGKETSGSGFGELISLNKQGLTGGTTYRADASQQWKTNGDSIFGFKVGIGTCTPNHTLHISAFDGCFALTGTRGTGTTHSWYTSGINNQNLIFNNPSGDSYFYSNSTPVLSITTNRFVGIGLNGPSQLLHIQKDQNATTTLLIQNTADGSGAAAELRFYGNVGAGSIKNNQQISFVRGSSGVDWAIGQPADSDNFVIAGGTDQGDGKPSLGTAERLRITSAGIIYALNPGVDGAYCPMIGGMYSANNNETNLISTAVSSVAAQSGFRFDVSNGAGSSGRTTSMTINRSSVSIVGSLSKGSGTFNIQHPLESKKCTHRLVHSFIEGPQADLIYRGKINLDNGIACINIDRSARMTEGTFEALNRCTQVFTTNESSWSAIRGKLHGNILIIESQNTESNDEISWMVIGQRQDKHMFETEWTDEEGRVITEPEIA